jgi:hypothetical protein
VKSCASKDDSKVCPHGRTFVEFCKKVVCSSADRTPTTIKKRKRTSFSLPFGSNLQRRRQKKPGVELAASKISDWRGEFHQQRPQQVLNSPPAPLHSFPWPPPVPTKGLVLPGTSPDVSALIAALLPLLQARRFCPAKHFNVECGQSGQGDKGACPLPPPHLQQCRRGRDHGDRAPCTICCGLLNRWVHHIPPFSASWCEDTCVDPCQVKLGRAGQR